MDDRLKREDFFDGMFVMLNEDLVDEFGDYEMKDFVVKEMLGKVFVAKDIDRTSFDMYNKECGVYNLREVGKLLNLRYNGSAARVGGSMLREVKGAFIDGVDLYE